MDFTEKRTHWVHLNFEARVGPKEEVLLFFAELYLDDGSDDKYVLATFSPAEATWMQKEEIVDVPVARKTFIIHGVTFGIVSIFGHFQTRPIGETRICGDAVDSLFATAEC
ncbi:concanavalin A-like lectin protein kinase family protein, partial [Striga asiatica]